MISTAALTGSHLRTYNTIFQHPVSHNLEWRHVHALFRHLGQVEEETNGNLKVTRNGQSLVLHPSRTKDVAETGELMALRHFLERSEKTPSVAQEEVAHWLLVIDHHEARHFRTEFQGADPIRLTPHEPGRYSRHDQNSENLSKGKEKPDPNTDFEPLVKSLQAGGPVLSFGAGKGKSREMEQLVSWLAIHHPNLSQRIIGTEVVDEQHLTDGQMLVKARKFYAHPAAARTAGP